MTPQEEEKREAEIVSLLDEQINHLRQINKGIMQSLNLTEAHIGTVNNNISQILTLLKAQDDYI